ncbi:hypothetical protein [Halomicrobium sp. IBSBa]|nr:hypothetical protein [Halomicrobium sp. IBSBa]
MAVIGATAFAVILWGALFAVAAVFCYECYTVAAEVGLLARD